MVNGFGMFDAAVTDGTGGTPHQVLPGESDSFVFALTGAGSITELDFITELSELEPGVGGTPLTVVAKFVEGPGDASGYGGVVPEPGAMALLVLGGLLAVRRRNR